MEQFPSNSKRLENRSREEPKKVERVVQGEVTRRKTPRGRRMARNIVGGDARSVWDYVSTDILAPAFRDLVEDAFVGFITRMVRGEDSRHSPRSRRGGLSSRTDYAGISRDRHRYRDEPRRELSRRARSSHDLDEIILENRVDAEEVLDRMEAWIDKYGIVSLAEYYELCGISGNYTDSKYGWRDIRDIRDATISRARGGGFIIRLPQPEVLD